MNRTCTMSLDGFFDYVCRVTAAEGDIGSAAVSGCEWRRGLAASPIAERDARRPRRRDACAARFMGRVGVRCRSLQLAERGIDFPTVAAQAGKTKGKWKAKGQRLNAKMNSARTVLAFSLQPSAFPAQVRPISDHGNVNEIIGKFGGVDQLRNAVNQIQARLYGE